MSASVFPARAGMSRSVSGIALDASSVPRASGDEPVEMPISDAALACSPRERG